MSETIFVITRSLKYKSARHALIRSFPPRSHSPYSRVDGLFAKIVTPIQEELYTFTPTLKAYVQPKLLEHLNLHLGLNVFPFWAITVSKPNPNSKYKNFLLLYCTINDEV